MLRIVKASDPVQVERLNLCIYAQPGVGKTTLAFTAEAPICLDFDKGAHRAANRRDIVQPILWSDVIGMNAADLEPYKTVIVDTAGRALDVMTADIISENPKAGKGMALTLQGYGILKTRFAAWLKMLNTFGKDVILIAHMDEQRLGDDIVERLDVQGGSKGEIYKSVDAMGRIFIRDKKRVIDFSPRENSFGKNPAGLDVLTIPDVASNNHFLADVISGIKAKLNESSEEQKAAQQIAQEWSEFISSLTDIAEFNGNLAQVKKASVAVQSLFAQKAKSLGFTFNKTTKLYEVPEVVNA